MRCKPVVAIFLIVLRYRFLTNVGATDSEAVVFRTYMYDLRWPENFRELPRHLRR